MPATTTDDTRQYHTIIRPDWMTDTDWNRAVDALGDLWFDLMQRAACS